MLELHRKPREGDSIRSLKGHSFCRLSETPALGLAGNQRLRYGISSRISGIKAGVCSKKSFHEREARLRGGAGVRG
ncbi:Uncharacterized protein DAT39_004259 [Clarias magur]|uniref:Uncharacterized protein n=1 Tax=Clarias magur TaxID=1594786 RepID=A0A8J4UDY0_CLAMG|nr:Uncharacterized protein DAT39_004259 [Clarias magur]